MAEGKVVDSASYNSQIKAPEEKTEKIALTGNAFFSIALLKSV